MGCAEVLKNVDCFTVKTLEKVKHGECRGQQEVSQVAPPRGIPAIGPCLFGKTPVAGDAKSGQSEFSSQRRLLNNPLFWGDNADYGVPEATRVGKVRVGEQQVIDSSSQFPRTAVLRGRQVTRLSHLERAESLFV
ncbi:Hypothetical predicted protein [Cloeon dipterum]|uniref:Uncharacterized protein n=1 Tax=Cloeon dipterum TaxID=197152 RepID=A0A8S1CB66_9INSE|nr:Hypothetical predicted protein [Cloeon dipterum]